MFDRILRVILRVFDFKKDRKLGVIEHGVRRYDLPLDHDPGTGFLMLLTGLLTFLAVLALCGASVAGTVSHHWVSGLAGYITIEIPAHDDSGKILSDDLHQALLEQAKAEVEKLEAVASVTSNMRDDVRSMIAPFLGDDIDSISDMPLPLLLTVKYDGASDVVARRLEHTMRDISPVIRVDAHESWLSGILRLSRMINISTIALMAIIVLTAVVALISAMRARMQIHRGDIELLHLMGASNTYIARQFQRHAWAIALRGSIGGVLVSVMMVFVLMIFISNGGEVFTLSSLSIAPVDFVVLAFMPFIVCSIASLSARFTVLRSLAQMP